MKNKLVLISISLMLIFMSITFVNAIAPTPRVELDEYQLSTTDNNNVYVNGNVTMGVGQLIGVYDATGKILYNYTQVANSNKSELFKVQIPARYISNGDNTYKVKSLPIKNVINGSNPKTVTVKYTGGTSKQNQTISANNISIKVGETKNLSAKSSSGLVLTYVSSNAKVATVNASGNVTGRSAGNATITIKQAGNSSYNPATKTISVTVTKASNKDSNNSNNNSNKNSNNKNKSCSHAWKTTVIAKATCTKTGKKQTKCTKCGKIKSTTTVKKLKHNKRWKVTRVGTCKTKEVEQRYCTRCGKVFKGKKDKRTTGYKHKWGAWVVLKKATCGTQGKQRRYCVKCAKPQIEKIKATGKHKWQHHSIQKNGEIVEWDQCTKCDKSKNQTTRKVKKS